MPLVVDASIGAVLAAVEREGLLVPDLWAREIANGLAVAYLRRRITTADEQAFLTALSLLSIDVEEPRSSLTAIREGTAAAMHYGLTAYDAAYVDLAAREGLALATLDAAMRAAAVKSGVVIF